MSKQQRATGGPTAATDDPTVNGAAGSSSARVLNRRRSLPGGRAVVGGFLVAAATVGVFAAYTDATAGPERSWVLASGEVAVGERLESGDLTVMPIDLPERLAATAFTDPADLVGAIALGPLTPGALIQVGDVVASPETPGAVGQERLAISDEVSFEIASSRALAGTLQPGERVDVLSTYGSGDAAYTMPVASGALVLDSAGGSDSLADDEIVLTLGLRDPAETLAIAHAVTSGDMIVVRTTAASPRARSARPGQARAYSPSPSQVRPDQETSGPTPTAAATEG